MFEELYINKGRAKCVKLFSPAIAGRGQLQKSPKKIKSGFGSGSPPNPFFSKLTASHAHAIPSYLAGQFWRHKQRHNFLCLLLNFRCHDLAWLQITSFFFRGKRESVPAIRDIIYVAFDLYHVWMRLESEHKAYLCSSLLHGTQSITWKIEVCTFITF